MKEITVTVKKNGSEIKLKSEKGKSLSSFIKENNLPVSFLCGGNGKCCKCRVTAEGELSPVSNAELKVLSFDEISRKTRLACFTNILGDCTLNLDDSKEEKMTVEKEINENPLKNEKFYSLCIDIGTTTVAVFLSGMGKEITEGMKNPQVDFGNDVISRIKYASETDSHKLTDVITRGLSDFLFDILKKNDIHPSFIKRAVITGNTAMLCLLLNKEVSSLGKYPFRPSCDFGIFSEVDFLPAVFEKGISVYFPKCPSAFIGADILCGMIASKAYKSLSFFIDIGTNSEIVLSDPLKNRYYCASAAAGSVFEGWNISCGCKSVSGAVTKVTPFGNRMIVNTIDNEKPSGLCGSGMISVVAALFNMGFIDGKGTFTESAPLFSVNGEDAVCIADDVYLTQSDIRSIQLAKSAVMTAMMCLLKISGLEIKDVENIFISGGFGKNINLQDGIRIKLFPEGFRGKFIPLGNTSLDGAVRLFDDEERIFSEELSSKMQSVNLTSLEYFEKLFIKNIDLD